MAVADVGKPLVKDLHEHIVCPLCRGYLIDATTLVECLHSFCRGCIVRRLGSGARACPVCGALTLPPLLPDFALQRLVYLAVPGLYRSELERRRHFRSVNPQCPPPAPPLGGLALTLDDAVSLSLCEILNDDDESSSSSSFEAPFIDIEEELDKTVSRNDKIKNHNNDKEDDNGYGNDDKISKNLRQIRYLKCPAGVTVRHLIRLLALKRGWGDTERILPTQTKRIEMLYQNFNGKKTEMRPLELSWTLLDLACIFKWDKETPMKLFYRIVKRCDEKLTRRGNKPNEKSSYTITACNGILGNNPNVNIENPERPPTPPPSPKQQSLSNPEVKPSTGLVVSRSMELPQLKSVVGESAATASTTTTTTMCKPSLKTSTNNVSVNSQSESKGKLKLKIISDVEIGSKLTRDNIGNKEELKGVDFKILDNEDEQSRNNCPSISDKIPILQTGQTASTEIINNSVSSDRGVKVKKPRCEVTPVMRAPGPLGIPQELLPSNKPRKVPRLEHHKRRKRRNKRLIAEITTTPREDLLKLKVRLTPCPPRITSGTPGSAKEKLLQMRAVRREKIKSNTCVDQRPQTPPSMPLTPPPSASAEKMTPPLIAAPVNSVKVNATVVIEETTIQMKQRPVATTGKDTSTGIHESKEETIEDIIDGIPDEVVRVAQNMNNNNNNNNNSNKQKHKQQNQQQQSSDEVVIIKEKEVKPLTAAEDPGALLRVNDESKNLESRKIVGKEKAEGSPSSSSPSSSSSLQIVEGPKDAEVLRRLGLVAISEASKTLQDKIRGSQSGGVGGSNGGGIDYHRESLERQLRESKANRVRSLLAEKQMRDALKSIMSKSKGVKGSSNSSSSGSTGPKKGPPPLAPLTLKQGFSVTPKSAHPAQILPRGGTGKNEKPLDLSSGAQNALDLSPTPSSSSSTNNPTITSTTYNSTPSVKPIRSKSNQGSNQGAQVQLLNNQRKSSSGGEIEVKKNQDLNLRTLSDAAVSLLGTNPAPTTSSSEVRITNSTILTGNKVALRIPQPHQRLSGFGNGMKIKPNLAVRHIPNPQAFVASQYRNQKTNFFNALQQQQQQPP